MLLEPYEYLDLAPGEAFRIQVNRVEDGSATIHPRSPTARHMRIHMTQRQLEAPPPSGTPITIETPVLRLYGVRLDQFSRNRYWDISSKTLRADLLARLNSGLTPPFVLSLEATGHAPLKRYSVTIGTV